MGIHHLTEMTWVEVDALDKAKSMVLLPISPIEEHGPHLPLGTDLFAATDMASEAARLVDASGQGYEMVLAPPIPLGCSATTADFPGTISLRGSTIYQVVTDVLTSLTDAGFAYIAITNHHLDPVHMKAILKAVDEVAVRSKALIFESASRIHYSGTHSDEYEQGMKMGVDMEKEVHAEIRETSFVLHRYPQLVKTAYQRLSPVHVDIKAEMKKGRRTFRQMGADQGYIGSPHLATESMGKLHLEEGARRIADLIVAAMRNESLPAIRPEVRHFLDNHVQLD
jgi:creatinine amidohydrolase